MKKVLVVAIILVAAAAGYAGYWSYLRFSPHQNPDPNHTHADFAVWVNSRQLDFSDAAYMSGLSTDAGSHPTDGPRKYLHLHDGNGHVIHRHKPGLTLGDFFASIQIPLQEKEGKLCMTIDGRDVCSEGSSWKAWSMFVNGAAVSPDPQYVFQDGDAILLTINPNSKEEVGKELEILTSDACRYSQTCPWKGAPPTENCIADPEVPCVQ